METYIVNSHSRYVGIQSAIQGKVLEMLYEYEAERWKIW